MLHLQRRVSGLGFISFFCGHVCEIRLDLGSSNRWSSMLWISHNIDASAAPNKQSFGQRPPAYLERSPHFFLTRGGGESTSALLWEEVSLLAQSPRWAPRQGFLCLLYTVRKVRPSPQRLQLSRGENRILLLSSNRSDRQTRWTRPFPFNPLTRVPPSFSSFSKAVFVHEGHSVKDAALLIDSAKSHWRPERFIIEKYQTGFLLCF